MVWVIIFINVKLKRDLMVIIVKFINDSFVDKIINKDLHSFNITN